MHRNFKLLLTIVGVGILGMLTGCGNATSIEMPTTMQQIIPEHSDSVRTIQKTVSENSVIQQPNQTVATESLENHSDNLSNSTINNASSGEIISDENKQSEPTPKEVTELIALADSEEEAQRIAELYEIDLKSYSLGVAVYTTDKNIAELLQIGKENNYPELSLNHKIQLY